MVQLKFDESDKWSLIGTGWDTASDGRKVLTVKPPWNDGLDAYDGQDCTNDDVQLALRTDCAYGDFDARFRFRWDAQNCGAGFMFRARDAQHYYLAHFPRISQVVRAGHFWALISKVDGNGWAEVLQMEIVPGVASEGGIWHDVRLSATGNEFRLWVDGRPLPAVRDDTFSEPGMVGFEIWQYAGESVSLSDFTVAGEPAGRVGFDANLQPVKNWHLPYPVKQHLATDPQILAETGQARQACTGITRTPDGNLLMGLTVRQVYALVTSADNGRSWQRIDSPSFPGGWVHTLRSGRLITLHRESNWQLIYSESSDNGRTWSPPSRSSRNRSHRPTTQTHRA